MAYKARSNVGATPRLRGENEPQAARPHEGKATGVRDVYEEMTPEGRRVLVVSRNVHNERGGATP